MNHTRGLSLLATVVASLPPVEVSGAPLSVVVLVPPPQAARLSAMAAVRDSARILFFIAILLFPWVLIGPSLPDPLTPHNLSGNSLEKQGENSLKEG